MDIVKVVVGSVVGVILATVAVVAVKATADSTNIVKVVNDATKSENFSVSDKIDTGTLLGRQAGAINANVDGYKAYKDRYVVFYVENPRLKLKDSKTFIVNFKTNDVNCRSIFSNMDLHKFNVKDITINGDSVKALKQFGTGRKEMSCAGNNNKEENAIYDLKYEFYFNE